ncbi:hypothetical protein [Bacillus sp. OK048]|uniref:hypothetical protein n=1 Tax=Bacillus sp. OK048 TaxID=1882761 RepID=UPI000B892F3B|nr:hypothetical protein [Bacillus sp. OK048]
MADRRSKMAGGGMYLAGKDWGLDVLIGIWGFLKINREGKMMMASLATGFYSHFWEIELIRQVNKGIWQVKWNFGR